VTEVGFGTLVLLELAVVALGVPVAVDLFQLKVFLWLDVQALIG